MMRTKIHRITNNNPVRIQFTDGNVTRYVYSATGEKLRACSGGFVIRPH